MCGIFPLKAQIYTPGGTIEGTSGNNNVGIGTAAPAGKLHVNNAGTSGELDYNLIIQKTEVADVNKSAVGLLFSVECCGAFGKSAIVHERTGSYGIGNLHFLNGNAIDRSNPTLSDTKMTINSNGNVGIGTTSPDEKLTVKGKIHTQEVRVDMLGPLVPDYVFTSDYKLKSLQEVETYIKQNNHLPEIPSAKEIEKSGLMLAEMNMNLLKKMEEMTLYMIAQNKEMETRRKENITQSKEIELQSKEIETLKKENKSFKTLFERLSKIENQLKTVN
jgi:hypothetical protein